MTDNSISILAEEVRIWNTPLVSAYGMWQFTRGYCNSHPTGDAPVGILHFIAAPLLGSPQLSESITNRRKSLQSYASGFEDRKQIDILLSLQERIRRRRHNTLSAIDTAIRAGLLSWDSQSGKLYPHDVRGKAKSGKAIRLAAAREGKKAEILGSWFAAHDVPTIASYLMVIL